MEQVLAAGTRIGRYEIVRRLALGGMAEIYLARMTGVAGFAKHVVLKRILPSFAQDAEFVRMFLNEARYAATLDHPNISHVYDFGQEGGLYYYAMEYLHGDDCRALLRELAGKRERMPLAHALTIVVGAATGCHFAHELVGDDDQPLGLVHRDVSPSNVVVTFTGAVKLVDFGIAKATSREDATAAGVTKGKLAYMAPEQCRAEPLDRRVDVYALGVLLYELTTQRRAFTGDNDAAIIWAVMSGQVTWPSALVADYPPALEAIVKRAMHFDRAERYPTARALAEAVEGYARDAGLALAANGLAEFFTAVMGARPEPWREHGERAATANPTATPSGATPSGTTPSVTQGSDDAPTYTPAGLARTPLAGVPSLPGPSPLHAPGSPPLVAPPPRAPTAPAIAPTIAPRASRGPWIVAGLAAVVAAAVVAYALTRPSSSPPPVAMVTERGTASVEAHDGGAPVPLDAGVIDAAAAPVDGGTARARPDARPRPASGSDGINQAFDRKKAAIDACVQRHATADAPPPPLALRFRLDATGTPTSVELSPASIASSPLGACVLGVARSTRFPPQPDGTTFTIPLGVRLQP